MQLFALPRRGFGGLAGVEKIGQGEPERREPADAQHLPARQAVAQAGIVGSEEGEHARGEYASGRVGCS